MTFDLTEQSRQTPIGELLDLMGDDFLEIVDESERLVATIVRAPSQRSIERAANLTDEEVAVLRRRLNSPRELDITHEQLMERLRKLEAAEIAAREAK